MLEKEVIMIRECVTICIKLKHTNLKGSIIIPDEHSKYKAKQANNKAFAI